MKIENVKEAIDYAVEIIKKYEVIITVKDFNMEKGVAGAYIFTDKNKYLVSFQKNLYRKFEWEEFGVIKKGFGVALPEECLNIAKENNFIPMKILDDGKMYLYDAEEWINFVKRRKESRIVFRKKEDREVQTDNWDYGNIPLSYMVNYEKWITEK